MHPESTPPAWRSEAHPRSARDGATGVREMNRVAGWSAALAFVLIAAFTPGRAATIEQLQQDQRLAISAFQPVGQSFIADDERVDIAFSYLIQNPGFPDSK